MAAHKCSVMAGVLSIAVVWGCVGPLSPEPAGEAGVKREGQMSLSASRKDQAR